MGVFDKTAYDAYVDIINNKTSFGAAWDSAVKNYTASVSMQKKCCPKDTFLGLCRNGRLKGINGIKGTDTKENAIYADILADLFLNNQNAQSWNKVNIWAYVQNMAKNSGIVKPARNENSQINVVRALLNYLK